MPAVCDRTGVAFIGIRLKGHINLPDSAQLHIPCPKVGWVFAIAHMDPTEAGDEPLIFTPSFTLISVGECG